jgi:hypothetical protein
MEKSLGQQLDSLWRDHLSKQELARQFAAQAWCGKTTSNKVMDPVLADTFACILDAFIDGIQEAWNIIANSDNGDWENASPEWKQAAEKWRDNCWHRVLDGKLPE